MKKKVKEELMHDYVEHHYVCSYSIYLCPNCECCVEPVSHICKKCGQELDWNLEDNTEEE